MQRRKRFLVINKGNKVNETSNTDTLTVPQAESKHKATRKPKPATQPDKVALMVREAVDNWKHGIAPNGIDAGAKVVKYGQDTGRKNKLGESLHSRSLVISTPTAKALRDANPALSVDEANAKAIDIGQSIKPVIMGRVAHAGASASFIVRRYAETPSDKGKHKLSLTLEKVNTETTAERLARECKITVDEVYKRMPELKPALTVAV